MKKICVALLVAVFFMIHGVFGVFGNTSVGFSLPFSYQWGSGGLVRGLKYQVCLNTSQSEAPMPKGSSNRQYIMELSEKETKASLPEIVYTQPGDYKYDVQLVRENQRIVQSYHIHIQVLRQKNGNLSIVQTIGNEKGKKVISITFKDPAVVKPGNNHGKDNKKDNKKYNVKHNSKHHNIKHDKKNDRKNSGKSSKTVKTGDDRSVEFYLMVCVVSLFMLLLIGKNWKNKK